MSAVGTPGQVVCVNEPDRSSAAPDAGLGVAGVDIRVTVPTPQADGYRCRSDVAAAHHRIEGGDPATVGQANTGSRQTGDAPQALFQGKYLLIA